MKGGEKVDEETKSPCTPVEEAGRDETAVFCETDPLCAALDELCAALNCWYAAMNNPWQREDRAYRKQLAAVIQMKLKEIAGGPVLEGFDDISVERAEKAGYENVEE